MNTDQQKVVQYLNEAEATERALERVLQSQIAMTPHGSYRSILETHLDETRNHSDLVAARLQALRGGGNPLGAIVGLVESAAGQALALTKTPFDLLRGSGGEEKVLKNAKDACASEALEIATYTAIERLAQRVGDQDTARMAASIRSDEEKMLKSILREIPRLSDAVVGAEIEDDPSYDVATTGAADAVRQAGRAARAKTTRTAASAKRTARKARKVAEVAQGEDHAKDTAPSGGVLAIDGYDELAPHEITAKLPGLSQIDLARIDAYERNNQNRSQILTRVEWLRADEPWAGYDVLPADDVIAVLSEGDDDRTEAVASYERRHKNRAAVLHAAARALAAA
jgi:ferritin-like metal-binding protein YciE